MYVSQQCICKNYLPLNVTLWSHKITAGHCNSMCRSICNWIINLLNHWTFVFHICLISQSYVNIWQAIYALLFLSSFLFSGWPMHGRIAMLLCPYIPSSKGIYFFFFSSQMNLVVTFLLGWILYMFLLPTVTYVFTHKLK